MHDAYGNYPSFTHDLPRSSSILFTADLKKEKFRNLMI
jgi:hypothetical protein